MRFFRLLTFILSISHFFLVHSLSLGDFEQISGSPFGSGEQPRSIAFSPLVDGNVFAAVANTDFNSISVYTVDRITGVFTEVAGSPFTGSLAPYSVAFSPLIDGHLFAAVANYDNNSVSVYTVDRTTGVFTIVAGSPFTADIHPSSVAFSPLVDGKLFAAVANFSNRNVSVYTVNNTTGFFTQVSGSPFDTGVDPLSVAFSPLIDGRLFAAVANNHPYTVSVYSVDETTGAFTGVIGSPFNTGSAPSSVAFSPLIDGNLFAAVANSNSNNVSVYTVNSATGAFTEITGSPFTAGLNPSSVAFSPLVDGNLFAAVANTDDENLSVYSVNGTTGAFTSVGGSPFGADEHPVSVAFSPFVNGNLFAAAANFVSNNVSVYSVVLPPTVTGITPSQGSSSGGTTVTITGAQFQNVLSVLFGTSEASFTVDSEAQITAISPAGSGTVDITVTTSIGTSATSGDSQFTYIPPTPPILPPSPPTHVKGCHKVKLKNDKIYNLIVLKWKAPSNEPLITESRIYKDKALSKLEGSVSSNKNLRFTDKNQLGKSRTYYIVSVNIYGDTSEAVKVKTKKSCRKHGHLG